MSVISLKEKYHGKAEFILERSDCLFIMELESGNKEYLLFSGSTNSVKLPSGIKSFKALGNKDMISDVVKKFSIKQVAERLIETDSRTQILFDNHMDRLSFKAIENTDLETESSKVSSVLIIDDSAVIRKLLTRIVNKSQSLEVCFAASGPEEAIQYLKSNKPDIITLDIHMPEMDGVTLFKTNLKQLNIPTVVISSMSIQEGPMVMEALSSGVLAYIEKPDASNIKSVEEEIIKQLTILSKQKLSDKAQGVSNRLAVQDFKDNEGLIAIGSSTGGTKALETLLTSLPKTIPPILIVQHIPAVFSKAFADRLDTCCSFTVKEIEDGEEIMANTAYIAKGGKQFKVQKLSGKLVAELIDDACPSYNFKPSVDYLFESIKEIKPKKLVAVILTGMGKDGSKSLLELRNMGAHTIGQNAESCVVYGMPRVAFEIGACMEMIHLNDMASSLVKAYNKA